MQTGRARNAPRKWGNPALGETPQFLFSHGSFERWTIAPKDARRLEATVSSQSTIFATRISPAVERRITHSRSLFLLLSRYSYPNQSWYAAAPPSGEQKEHPISGRVRLPA